MPKSGSTVKRAAVVLMIDGYEMHLHQEYHSCGRANCRFCNRSDGTKWRSHGPYWYAWYLDGDGKRKTRYIGRTLPFR